MSASKFKFVSPGIFISEIDNSQRPRTPSNMGPVIIGRSERGPGLRPVKIDSFSQFIEVFGEPIPGGQSGDVWRDGNYTAPTYAAYAAQAYLKNAGPITFVRLLGADHSNNSALSAKAGWSIAATTAGLATQGGAYGLVLMKKDAGGGTWNGDSCLAGIFYTPDAAAGYRLALAGDDLAANTYADGVYDPPGPTIYSSTGVWIKATSGTSFTMALRDENAATVVKKFSFDFSASSSKSLRKVFNTNPTKVGTITSDQELYWLGETFERKIASVLASGNGAVYAAALVPMSNTANASDHNRSATPGSTPWTFSQFTGAVNTDTSTTASLVGTSPLDVSNLFKLHGLHNGDWESKNLKISVTDIKAPTSDYNKYGTFTVEIRHASDTDGSKRLIETFSGLNLNPISPDFIGRRIGDKYSVWNDAERRYVEYGQYDNASNYFRVEVASAVANGQADPSLLPMGFYGPDKYRDMVAASGAANAAIGSGDEILKFVPANIYQPHGGAPEDISDAGDGTVATTIVVPGHELRTTADDPKLSDPTDAYFGITLEDGSSNRPAEDYADLVRPLPASSGLTPSFLQHSFLFSLEDIVGSTAGTGATHTPGSHDDTTSLNGATGLHTTVLDAGYNKFTMPVQGGFNGLDITERDPFRNSLLSGEGELTHYAFNSIKRSVDASADPEVVECNLMSIPGIHEPALTNHLIRVCENRGDALAVIDLEDDYIPDHESNLAESSRLPAVSTAISSLKARGLNSSYGCAYFPWIQLRDSSKGQLLWAPPSIAALGTMASSAANTELWFAPAGFTRGGLSEGSAGVAVVGVRSRLTSKDRDKLYDVNINPIASFPSEGIVIFGQKTLQVTPSALDRINVRRLMIFLKKEVSRMAATVLFDQNVRTTWARFSSKVNPFLSSVKSRFGLTEYRLILDETTTTPELVDRNVMYAKILLKPARAIEYIAIDFVITDSGASFAD